MLTPTEISVGDFVCNGGEVPAMVVIDAVIRLIPGVADARIQQSPSSPSFDVNVDRTRAQYVGLTARDVTNGSL